MASWKDVARIVATLPDYEALGADAPDGDILGARVADDLTELVTDAWLAQAPKTLAKKFLANGDS